MNDYSDKTGIIDRDASKFDVILGGIQESTAEIRGALDSIRGALHRFQDTNVPSSGLGEKPESTSPPRDLTGKLEEHSNLLLRLRSEAIELSRKINELI